MREETLLKSGEIRSGGFGGPLIKFSPVNGKFGVLVGGRGGWLINSVFSIGGGAYGLANEVRADHPDSLRLDMGVGIPFSRSSPRSLSTSTSSGISASVPESGTVTSPANPNGSIPIGMSPARPHPSLSSSGHSS